MLVTFYSDAYENITMFGDVAHRLLIMMGQSGTVPGAILAKDVSKALTNLNNAIDREKKIIPPKPEKGDDEDEEAVSIAHRALPLLELLSHAEKKKCDVLWK